MTRALGVITTFNKFLLKGKYVVVGMVNIDIYTGIYINSNKCIYTF